MKKRILTWLLAVGMLASLLTVPAGAANATRFSDVADNYTATAIETLRLMGVLDGYSDGTFRPNAALTRAQFCKMAVYAMDGSSELGRYSTVTIFPDVKPSFWASSYINMAAKKGIIAGFADGKFKPNQTVTAGQAVTILMRGLGYKDENMGGVWPQGYMAEAKTCGLLKSTGITSAYSALTRGQAAKLFLNLFEAKRGTGEGAVVLFSFTPEKEEVYLTNLDAGKGTLTAGGKPYTMAHPVTSTSLIGSKGKVVLNGDGDILTFLPVTGGSGISNAAVIIGANGSALGLDSLTGGSGYTIYKNGSPASAADLKKYDVATYSAATNSVVVCDTKVSVYYEDCTPSPSNPTTITVLGTELNVLPTAVESLSQFKPGQQMILLLTADGQVAGAVTPNTSGARSNALAVVDASGGMQLICGSTLVKINGSGSGYENSVVSVTSIKSGGKAALSLRAVSGKVSGDLDVQAGTLGGKKLAANAMIFDGGKQVALAELSKSGVRASQISYARTNWAGEVDLIVLNNSQSDRKIYGRAIVKIERDQNGEEKSRTITIEYGNDKKTEEINSGNAVSTGTFVAVKLNKAGTMFTSFDTMSKLSKVSSGAWIGKTAVNYGGRTYEVPSDVQCYNADTGKWMEDLDAAKNYGGTMNLYAYDGVIRIVEVKG
ncbi:MAG: S-layer homology domain-containing protein [Dysosmobacter sp.]|jgi:hypothetical protein|nr:S-layer homology domain-containing protein [Dysosmobacter sp.]MDY3866199.1 S-layer homology domain-containing protein [Dysosmobacter sp.]